MATEKRLIDANEFVKNFWQRVHDGEIVTLMDVEHAIINAPTVDAVEVVRCKDCKCFYQHTQIDTDKGDCWCYGIGNLRVKHIDDFCSYGERRTQNA